MKHCLQGALWGDIVGSTYEWNAERDASKIVVRPKSSFTDDSVLTLAVAKAILEQRPYRDTIFELACAYPDRGYGGRFRDLWIRQGHAEPYNSLGNGAAMRVSPVGWAFHTVEDVLREAEASAACSHNHPMGIASAQATALAIFLARKGQDKEEIQSAIEERFGWTFFASIEEVRQQAVADGFDATWRAVVLALNVFLCTESFEACLREAIALGGDADTQAAIACSVAEAYYGPDEALTAQIHSYLTPDLRQIFMAFASKYGL